MSLQINQETFTHYSMDQAADGFIHLIQVDECENCGAMTLEPNPLQIFLEPWLRRAIALGDLEQIGMNELAEVWPCEDGSYDCDRCHDREKGWKAEVKVDGQWSQNGIVWPDEQSAKAAASDLYQRWFLSDDHRAVEVDEEPNRPTWEEYTAENGYPPQSVKL